MEPRYSREEIIHGNTINENDHTEPISTHCKILRTMSQLYISFKRKTVLAQPELEIKGGMSRKKLLLYLHSNISIFPALVDVSWETCAQKKMPEKCGQKVLIIDLREFTR